MDPADLTLVAKQVMKLLVERRFEDLEEATDGVRLSADAMADAVEEIGARLVMPPESVWKELRPRAVRNQPGAFELSLALWTSAGRTADTLEITVQERNGRPTISVDDIIVG